MSDARKFVFQPSDREVLIFGVDCHLLVGDVGAVCFERAFVRGLCTLFPACRSLYVHFSFLFISFSSCLYFVILC